jgi:antitoxin ParD1/3/4
MQINLKPELETFLIQKVETGQYKSLEEAINQGIELLKNRDEVYQGRLEELQQEIMLGVKAAENGEFIDGDVLFQQLENRLKHIQNHQNYD